MAKRGKRKKLVRGTRRVFREGEGGSSTNDRPPPGGGEEVVLGHAHLSPHRLTPRENTPVYFGPITRVRGS